MPAQTDSVRGRIALANEQLEPRDLALGVAVVAAVGFALVVLQDPAAHEALHDFRHSAGVVCH